MTTVNLSIPFEALVTAIQSLSLEQQQQLREILEDQLFEAEEDWEYSPEIMAEVTEAKTAYHAGDYMTFDEYLSC